MDVNLLEKNESIDLLGNMEFFNVDLLENRGFVMKQWISGSTKK